MWESKPRVEIEHPVPFLWSAPRGLIDGVATLHRRAENLLFWPLLRELMKTEQRTAIHEWKVAGNSIQPSQVQNFMALLCFKYVSKWDDFRLSGMRENCFIYFCEIYYIILSPSSKTRYRISKIKTWFEKLRVCFNDRFCFNALCERGVWRCHRKWNYYTTYYEQFLPKKWSGLVCVASNICYAASNEGKYNPESVCLHEYASRLVCDSLFVCLDIGASVFTWCFNMFFIILQHDWASPNQSTSHLFQLILKSIPWNRNNKIYITIE